MIRQSVCLAVCLTGAALGFRAAPAVAATVISEVFYDASGSDAGLAFVELFGTPGESVEGLVLEGVNGQNGSVYASLALSGVIPADGVFVVGDDVGGGVSSVAGADMVGDVDYQNGPDSVVLRNPGGILDALGYGSFGSRDIFAGEGAAAPDPPAGSSVARSNPRVDTNDNSVDFIALDVPTPGTVPSVSGVPLPAAFWLFAAGLLGMWPVARRKGNDVACGQAASCPRLT